MANAQWGSFLKEGNWQRICTVAAEGMQAIGYQIWEPGTDNDYLVVGGHGDLIVQVVVVPQGSYSVDGQNWVVVTGFSENPPTAEQGRNEIRTHIVNTDCMVYTL
ncbi:MAG: hypothetical protein ACRDRS_13860 [Pseudonocardiaceae bacterium]